jgi:hypothetical protein
MILAASVVSTVIVLTAIAVAAKRSRSRWADEPTDLLPLLEDPLGLHFDEAERLLRGETDPDIAAIYDRRALRPYEDELQTLSIRRLTRRLARLDQT